MTECKFHIGDCVEAVIEHPDANKELYIGDTGTVCHIVSATRVGVEWDKELTDGHDCDEHCEYGYGWYVNTDTIRIREEEEEFDIDDGSFLKIVMG